MSGRDTLDVRAWTIAANARRYALIARRPEFQSPDREVRVAHALAEEPPGPLHLFDAAMVIGASELDRFCGYAVAVLSLGGAGMARLLDALGVLDDERVVAIYFALPDEARDKVVRMNGVFAVTAARVESAFREAETQLEDMVSATPATELSCAVARADVALAAVGTGQGSTTAQA
jgi:hypothetical protein